MLVGDLADGSLVVLTVKAAPAAYAADELSAVTCSATAGGTAS